MSDEVVTPGQLAELKEPLVEAIINAYMRKELPAQLDNFYFDAGDDRGGSCAGGEFRFKGSRLGPNLGIYCYYPSGQWKVDHNVLPDGTVDPGGIRVSSTTVELPELPPIWDAIRAEVDSWIDPWINECPSPNVFTNQINSVANVAQQLYVSNEISFGGAEVHSPGGLGVAPASAVGDVRTAIDEIKLSSDDLSGKAIDAFQRAYVADIERTLGGQRGLATAAGLAITAEAVAWNETYKGLRDFLQKAEYDFNQFAGSHSASGHAADAVLNAISLVTGLASVATGLAFPPFGAVMGLVSGVTTVAGVMFTPTEEVRAESLSISGGSYSECWESFLDGIHAIDANLTGAEGAIISACARVLNDYRKYPDNYSLAISTGHGQGHGDGANAFFDSQIDISHLKMKRIAGAIESIGDHQRTLASRLDGMDGAGNPSTLVQDEWNRGNLPSGGFIGDGYLGPFYAYRSVVETLTDLLIAEQKTAHRFAETCIDIALDFTATDRERERALHKLERKFDTLPVPVVNAANR